MSAPVVGGDAVLVVFDYVVGSGGVWWVTMLLSGVV